MFSVYNQISINGDLNLTDVQLNVFDEVYLNGKLMTSAQVNIIGKHLIYQSINLKDQSPIALTKNKQNTSPVVLTNQGVNRIFQIGLKQKITNFKDITFNSLNTQHLLQKIS